MRPWEMKEENILFEGREEWSRPDLVCWRS